MLNKTFTNNYIFQVLFYLLLSVIIYTILFQLGYVENLPNSHTLTSSDAGFYESIKTHGYQASGEFERNSGFFPLFPYLWRLTHLGFIGISIFNLILSFGSLIWLCKILKPDKMVVGFFMASPYLCF